MNSPIRARWRVHANLLLVSDDFGNMAWRRSTRDAHVHIANAVSRLRSDLVTRCRYERFGRVLGRFNGDGGAVNRRCYFELQVRKMAPTRVILMSCGSYNPPTNMHLRMFGTYPFVVISFE